MEKDIIIIGAGPTALSFIAAMRNSGLSILCVEKSKKNFISNPKYDGREIALTHSSKRTLIDIGVWQDLKEHHIHKIKYARVINGISTYSLDFNKGKESPPILGNIASNHQIKHALYNTVCSIKNCTMLFEQTAESMQKEKSGFKVRLSNGNTYKTPLLIAADSRFSQSRGMLGFSSEMKDYARTAILCKIKHEQPHHHCATEFFSYGHTLAVLPLSSNESSLVVTVDSHLAPSLLAMNDKEYTQWITIRLDNYLGSFSIKSKRFDYPLYAIHATNFVKQHAALLGDAAVGMHPVTAHGFNLGLASSQLLAAEILNSIKNQQPHYNLRGLKNYERTHTRQTKIMYHSTNSIVKLFTSETIPAKIARSSILRIANNFSPLKSMIEEKLTR